MAQPGDIVVTGFRRSLEEALNVKRNSIGAVDAIVAEDIAKFPDQNLAESLQRIPGIAINRDGGEGREITVRGLSGQFTTVRVNGMEAEASTYLAGSGGGVNNNRSFDFNQFASELFRNLIVHKTGEASLDEGSLGAVVDLNTGHPLGAKSGLHGGINVQAVNNDLSRNTGPKISGLLNWKNEAGTLGINVSAAYAHTKQLELGNNSTRWEQAAFNSVTTGGATYNCWNKVSGKYVYSPGGGATGLAACNQAALAFHPRIPRYGDISHDRNRQGYTGAIEWQPSSKTNIEIDGLYSYYHEIRTEQWSEILFRNDDAGINVLNPTYDTNGNMIAGTFSGQTTANNTNQASSYFERHENYYQDQRDKFFQISGHWNQQLASNLKAVLSAGASEDDQATPIATTLVIDNPTAAGYSYNYANMASPTLNFGTDTTNPNNYTLDEIRDRPTDVKNKFQTVKLDTDWEPVHDFHVKMGGFYRAFEFDYISGRRDSTACVNK
ncbi:MAG: TonB-dependent receptor plug domain-containing protein, partial [Alphaproteobacteria bacterium]|nr:TonB-dependent receptor plug domain-containing protein [Alphaproteobacteria bacterium]